MTAYQEKLRRTISKIHGTDAIHVGTVAVQDLPSDEVQWKGNVEVFDLVGHPKAKRSYAWGYPDGDTEPANIFTILELPPVESAQTAVKQALGGKAS